MTGEFNLDARVDVAFAEDLNHSDVAPLLDGFSEAGVFDVRSRRVAWSGPAGGGPEVALIIAAALGVGAASFAKTFGEELAKDTYKAVRTAIIGIVRRLRAMREDERRSLVGVVVVIRDVSFPLGEYLHLPPPEGEWTDEWLVTRLRRAQAAVDGLPPALWTRPLKELRHEAEQVLPAGPIAVEFYWDDERGDWVPEESMRLLIEWVQRREQSRAPRS